MENSAFWPSYRYIEPIKHSLCAGPASTSAQSIKTQCEDQEIAENRTTPPNRKSQIQNLHLSTVNYTYLHLKHEHWACFEKTCTS